LHRLAIWLVESIKARIWSHYPPKLVKFFHPGMLFEQGRYPVHQMLMYTKIEGMKTIGNNNSCWRD
jgi:hypothetical protein